MYTGSSSYSLDCGGGGEGTEKTQFPFSVASAVQNGNTTWIDVGSFPLFPPSPTDKIIISLLADMLSWAVWFKFLLNEVIANTCLFIVTSFSKQSASWKVLEICEMCALSTDSPKTYPVNKYMYTGSNSYSFDWGGEESEKTQFPFSVASAFQNGNTTWEDVWSFPYMYTGSSSYSLDCGGGRNGKDPISLFCCISRPKWKHYMNRCWVFSVISSQPHWQNYYFPTSWYA